jgi:glycyl-tRNA synthetase beta chain
VDLDENLAVDTALFVESIESDLCSEYQSVISKEYINYEDRLTALFSLKPKLDSYFDDVMVNAEDEKLKANRINSVASIYKSFREIADIKEISI